MGHPYREIYSLRRVGDELIVWEWLDRACELAMLHPAKARAVATHVVRWGDRCASSAALALLEVLP